jgi:hypothetical protein
VATITPDPTVDQTDPGVPRRDQARRGEEPPEQDDPSSSTTDREDQSEENRGDEPERPDEDNDEPADLIALLPAARAARDDLQRQGRALTRDAFAAQLRRNGHSIRTSRASALLGLIRADTPAETGPRVGT